MAFGSELGPNVEQLKPVGHEELVSAAEIACFAYCPEQWRLQYGLGVEPGNRSSLDAGTRHHRAKAAVETVAGGSIRLGSWLAVIALAVLLLLWWLRP
jgi:hypothetical protein